MDLSRDYNLYAVFMKVCEIKSYSKVAEQLGYSAHQSISDKMVALAKQLGVKTLFVRHSRGVVPTAEALKLYEKVKSSFEASMREFNENSPAVIKMIVPATFVTGYMADFFKEFQKKYKNFVFEFFHRISGESYELFLQKEIDVVIDLKQVCEKYNLEEIELVKLRHIFIASKKFLKDKNLGESIGPSELDNISFIAHRENVKMVSRNFSPNIFIKTASLEPILPLVENGTGIGIYPKEFFEQQNKNDDVIEIEIANTTIDNITMICGFGKDATRATKIFVSELKKYCDEKLKLFLLPVIDNNH